METTAAGAAASQQMEMNETVSLDERTGHGRAYNCHCCSLYVVHPSHMQILLMMRKGEKKMKKKKKEKKK